MMTRILALACATILAACVVQAPVTPGGGGAAMTATAPADAGFDSLLASARSSAGLAPVSSAGALDAVALAHARDMVSRNYFAHVTPDGVDFGARLRRAGLRTCAAAENIAFGQGSASAVMTSWMGSGGHRANILNRNVTSYGLGRVGNTWVLVLARPC